MMKAVKELTGAETLPYFTQNVLYRHELTSSLKELHIYILQKENTLKKEELFLYLLEELIRTYSDVAFLENAPERLRSSSAIFSV